MVSDLYIFFFDISCVTYMCKMIDIHSVSLIIIHYYIHFILTCKKTKYFSVFNMKCAAIFIIIFY